MSRDEWSERWAGHVALVAAPVRNRAPEPRRLRLFMWDLEALADGVRDGRVCEKRLRVVQGLPQDARMVECYTAVTAVRACETPDQWQEIRSVQAVFEHPCWDWVAPGGHVPGLVVTIENLDATDWWNGYLADVAAAAATWRGPALRVLPRDEETTP